MFYKMREKLKRLQNYLLGDTYTATLNKAFLQESVLNQNNSFKNTIQNLPIQLNDIHNRTHTYFHLLKGLIVHLQYITRRAIEFEE